MDAPDEDSADTALDITPEPNSETNGSSEDVSGSDSDAEIGEDDMVNRSIPDLEDDGNDSSSDEEGDTKKPVPKGSKIAIPKTSVVVKEVNQRLTEPPVQNASEEPGQKTWPIEGYYDPRHRDPSYWYDN
jgi:hypothetical protein